MALFRRNTRDNSGGIVMKKLIVDLAEGTQRYVDLTPEEIEQALVDQQNAEIERAEREAAEAAKVAAKESAIAKLKALGLTEEEATAIL